ncbi:MAG: hypothetical protein H6820_16130 [Phycisphaerales bacterium]|nr:hypothetical protein [Phycisphaerales bacterium]
MRKDTTNMLSDMMIKRVRGLMTSLAVALMALTLSLGGTRAIAAPFGSQDEPKPSESKDKDKDEKKSDEKKEDKKDEKDKSEDKKDSDAKDDEKKSDDASEKKDDAEKSDIEKERERVARENEAAKQEAMKNLGSGMTAEEKAAFEAQLEALKQQAIQSVGKTPPAPKTPATKPAQNATIRPIPPNARGETDANNPPEAMQNGENEARVRKRIGGPREGLVGRQDAASKAPAKPGDADKTSPDSMQKPKTGGSDFAEKIQAKSSHKKLGETEDTKTNAEKRQDAIEKAQERAKDRRAEIESKRRARLEGLKTRGAPDDDKDAGAKGSRTRPSSRPDSGADDEAGETGDGVAHSPMGVIPHVNIKITDFAEPDQEFSFNYEDTPWMDVVADFARMSHRPFVRNLDDEITGTLTYFSLEKMSYDQAYHKLNELLFDQPLNNLVIQRLPDRITVVRIPDLLKEIPNERIFGSFEEFKAANLDPYTACQTQYVVPTGFTPYQIIEEYRPLFSDTYGVKISDDDKLELTGFAKEHLYFDEMVRHLTGINKIQPPGKFVTIQLEHAKANDVLTLLRQLYPIQAAATPPPGNRRGRGRRQPQPQAIAPDVEDADQVSIIADAKANKLYITAPEYYMTELRMRIAELDVPTESPPEMEVVMLERADASAVIGQLLPIVQNLKIIVDGSTDHVDPLEKSKYNVTLYPSGNGNGIIIVGGRKGIDFIRPLIEAHDIDPDWITKSIPLYHRDASYIVERLENAMPDSGGGGAPAPTRAPRKGAPAAVAATDSPPPSIEIESSRSLFVSATQFDMKLIEELVQKLDVVDPEEPSDHFIYVKCAIPTQVAQTVQQIMAEDSTPTVVQQPAAQGNAKARALARQRAARSSRGRSTQSGGDGPLIIPNDADQSLLVYCSDNDWVEVQRLIDRLESNACGVEPQWVQFKLKKAEPTDVAAMLNEMFPAPAGATQIVNADSFNKTVNIYATPMFVEKITPLIEKLDENSTGELTFIKLQWAKAEIIAPIIQQAVPESQYLSPAAGVKQAQNAARRGKTPPKQANPRRIVQSAGDTAVRIVAEPVTNSLLVTAPPEKMQTIQDLVDQMEAVAEARRPEKVIVNVVNRKADEIAGVLTSILNATQAAGAGKDGATGGSINPTDIELSITAIGDQLILFGPTDDVAEAIQLVEQIDTLDAMPITRKVRVYDAEEDEKKLRAMLALKANTKVTVNQAAPAQNARGRNRPTAKAPTALTDAGATVSDVQIYANTYENTLLIRAMPKDWTVIDQILDVIKMDIDDIDDGTKPPDTFYIVELKHKSAWDISYDLEDVINTEGRRPVTFKEGPREKDLIVMNFRPSQRAEIDKWIAIYDVPKDGEGYGSGYATIDVKGGMSANDAARLLKARAGSKLPIDILEVGSGSPVQVIDIHAGETDAATTEETQKADRGADGKPVSALPPHMLPLFLRDVVCAAAIGQTETKAEDDSDDSIRNFDPRVDSILNPPTDRVQILTDPDTGKLILLGPDEEVQRLKDLLEDLMSDEKSEAVIRVFPLKYAPVSEVAQKLSEIVNGPAQRAVPQGRGARVQPGQQPGQPQPGGKGDEKGGKGAQQPQAPAAPATPARIKVVANERTSSIVVTAPPKEIPLVIELLKHLDSPQIVTSNMRMFEMKNLDASQVVQNLKEVLGIEDQPRVRAPQRGGNPRAAQQQVQIQGADGDTLVSADKVKLTAETQTNTVIAQGPPDTLDLIEKIINDLEAKTNKTAVEMMRVVLKKARASEIADIVQNLIDETVNNQTPAPTPQAGRGRGGRGRAPAAAARNDNVSVHADPRTNSVILAGPGDQLEKARKIVEDLDNTEGGLVIRQIPVKGNATEIANTLKTLYIDGGARGQSADVVITPLDATRTILIKAPEPLMIDIEEQLARIDEKFETSDKIRKIEMKFANAETVANQLNDLFGSGTGRRAASGRTAQISIRGYKSSGIIYVQAPDEEFERILAIATDLDKVDTSVQVHRKPLKHAPAQQVLQKIQAMMAEAIRSGAMGNTNLDYVSMQADPRTNSLILVGGPTSALLLDSMLATIDVDEGESQKQDTQVYTLPPTVVLNDIVRNINEVFRGVSLASHGVEPPVVTPNEGAHLVIVRANAKQHEQIKRDIIDPVTAGGDKGVRTDHLYAVKNAKALDLANVLSRHVRETMQQVNRQYPVNIVPDEGTNQLIVNATQEDFDKIKPMIEALDQESGERTTEVFKVQYVSPWSMATIINQQFQSRGSRNPNDQVNASFEDGTYSLIVTANKLNMEKVAALIEKADVPSKETVTKYVQLEHGQSDEMRNSIDAALRGRYPSDRRGQMPFSITSESLSNKLIVSAREDIMPEILSMIEQLDVPGGGEQIRRVFKLTYADPGSVSRMIQTIFRPVSGRRPSPREMVQSSDDWTTNSVIVSAVESKMAEVEALITEMDQPGDSVRAEHVIDVVNADPNDVATAIQQILQQQSQGQRSRQAAVVRAVRGTAKIVAYANEKEFQSIQSLVKQIDIEGGRIIHTVVIPDEVPARTVAENINTLFGRGGNSTDAPHAESHEPTNTLLVRATDAEFERIQTQVIQPLSTTDAKNTFKIYYMPVKNALADEVAQTMQAFFDKKNGISSNRGFGGFGGRGGQSNADRENQVTITAEPNSNTLIVFCTEKTKTEIDELLAVIDSADTTEKRVEMVPLQYVDAETMIEILTEVLRVSRTSAKEPDDRPWWMRDTPRDDDKDVVLAGDTRLKAITETNSVIVAGKPEAVEDALAKIAELDKPIEGGDTPVPVRLVNSNAATLAETLKQVFVPSGRSGGSRGGSGKSSGPELTIVPDQASNTLYVKGKLSEVNQVVAMARQMDAEADSNASGVVVIPIPFGQNVTELANMIETQINENERNEKQKNSNYTPDLVKITPNSRTNVLLVNASKSKLEDVKHVIDEMQQQMQFRGGPTRRVIKIDNITPEQARELIDKVKQGSESSGSSGNTSRRGRGGRSGDANWTHNRRYDAAMPTGKKRAGTMVAASMPVFLMNVALHTGVAQADAPKKDDRQPPRSMRIRPQQPDDKKPAAQNEPTTRRAIEAGQDKANARREIQPKPRNAAEEKIQSNAERLFRERAAAAGGPKISDETLEQLSKRLSGTDINVIEAPDGSIILEGLEQDVDIVAGILEMVDQATPQKQIEIVSLKNQLAEPLAQKLTSVFKTLEPPNPKPIDKVDFLADQRTNSIFIAAIPEKMEKAIGLVNMADQPTGLTRQTKSFVFKNRRVMEVGDTIKKIAQNYLQQVGLPTDQIQIEVDAFTNQIIVSAGEQDLEFIETIIKTLDVSVDEETAEKMGDIGKADVMMVPLRIAKADTLATLINELLTKAATGDTPMKDFIRRFRLLDENGNPLADVNLDRPIAVFGEPDSNSLIIASTKENCLVVKQIAMAFDKEPSKAAVESRVFTLAYADATEVASQLDAMLTASESITSKASGGGGPAGVPEGDAGALVYKAVVSADARTNQVVVIGRPEAVEVMGGLIAKLDVKGQGVMPFEIVKLNHANASGLATALTDLMDKRKEAIPAGGENSVKSETVIIVPDERSVSLIIAAKRERIEELKGLIAKLDVPATALIDNIRTLTLRNSTATDLAEKLKDLWSQSEATRQSGQGGVTFETPAIVADERSNSLIIAASESDFDAIKAVVDKIENLELNPMLDIYIHRLQYNSASELAAPLQAMFDQRAERQDMGNPRPEDKVKIESDPVTNALIFTASRENHDLLLEKVAELDQEIGVVPVVEFFRCENVYASAVKDKIDNLWPDVFKPGSGGENSVSTKRDKVSVVVDERANMLIVSASPENMQAIRAIYDEMNRVDRPWSPVDIKFVELKNTEATQLGTQVESYLEQLNTDVQSSGGSGGGSSQNQFAVRVIPIRDRNTLIVGGTRDGVQMALDFIAKYDQPVSPDAEQFISARVYPLVQAKAAQVGELLRSIFEARNNQSSGSGSTQAQPIPVTVEINEPGNSLVINAARQDHLLVQGLLAQLDVPSEIPRMFRVFPLAKASATVVKDTLDQIYQSSGAQGGGGGGQSIVTVADERTNSVVVAVPPGELDNVQKLVTQLDQVKITEIAEVQVIQCENEDASKMAELLNEIMTGQSAQGGGGSAAQAESARQLSSLLVTFEAKNDYGERDILQTVRENVQISYNERSNSVIVVAPPSSMRLIKKLVQKLDGIQKREVRVRVFPLANSDAAIMVEKLDSMFAQDEGSSDQQAFQQGREITVEGGASDVGAGPEFASAGDTRKGTFGRPRTTFVADERTNSVIAAGWPEDINVAADIIDALDSRDIQERITTVYPLVNMKADEVQGALDSYFQAQRDTLSSTEGVANVRLMEQDVTVVSHAESNQLIVSSSPRYQSEVLRIIQQLDAPPPQVMIEVMIAEVTLDDSFEMGMEFALQQLHFSETATAGPNGIIHSNSFDLVGGTDLGAAGAGLGGFSFTITGEDFNFLIRALQTDSRLDVIQRPMIMCQNNQTASINIGQQVPFVRGTTTTSGGNTQANIDYEDVGVILNVEPIINPDGFVYMLIEPEISSVTDSSVPIGNGIFAPIISNQSASTTVAVKDGETVVIGGLITTRKTEAESKVPVLGDLPGVGNLFRTTTRRNTRTELLIAMTPTIVRSVEDARRMSEFQRDIGGVITPEVKASPLMRQLQVQPESASEIDSIEVNPGSMRQVPSAQPQQIPIQPNGGPSYVPDAPRYGPVVPRTAPGRANVMVSGVASTAGNATPAAYQPAVATQNPNVIGTMRPALPTVDQVRNGEVPIQRTNPGVRPAAPRPAPQPAYRPNDVPSAVVSAPVRTYMRLPDDVNAPQATRPIVKISTHPSHRSTTERDAAVQKGSSSRRDTHR